MDCINVDRIKIDAPRILNDSREMLQDLCAVFEHFAAHEVPHSPLYQAACQAVSEAPDVAAQLNAAPPLERRPNLLLAAVHSLLLGVSSGTGDEAGLGPEGVALAAFYPNITTAPLPPHEGAGEAFVAFCRAAARALEPIIASRATQTNEVGRSSLLWPILSDLSEGVGPLHLVEVGASAGLNLLLDRWAYADADGVLLPGGDPSSPVRLRTRHHGVRPGNASIAIASRTGLDRDPIDVADPESAAWLLACMWPDELDRFERTRTAIEVAAANPPRLCRGDAVDDLDLVIPPTGDAHLTIVTTWMLAYLDRSAQSVFAARLGAIGSTRDLTWVFAESPTYAPGVPWPEGSDGLSPRGETLAVEVTYRNGHRHAAVRARSHPHGRSIDWRVHT